MKPDSVSMSNVPFFGTVNNPKTIEERSEKAKEDYARISEEYGGNIPAGNYDTFIVLEMCDDDDPNIYSPDGTLNYKICPSLLRKNQIQFTEKKTVSAEDIWSTPSEIAVKEYMCYKESESTNAAVLSLSGQLTDTMLAEHYADLGSRIEDMYKNGRITEDDYNMLNSDLEKYMEERTHAVESMRAQRHISREFSKMGPREWTEYHLHKSSLTPEEFQAERQARIDELIESTYKINREALMKMVSDLRNGIIKRQPSIFWQN